MAVLRHMTCNSGGGAVCELNAKPVVEVSLVESIVNVPVIGMQPGWKINEFRRPPVHPGVAGGVKIAVKILHHMRP